MIRFQLPASSAPIWLSAALLVLGIPAAAVAARVERGTLIFDNIPEPTAEFAGRLDAYLNSRRALPLGFSPRGHC